MAKADFILSEEYQTIGPGEPRGPLTHSGTVFHKQSLFFRDVGSSNGGRAWGGWETRMGERWVCLIGQPFRAHKSHHISYWRKTKHLIPDITITSSSLFDPKEHSFLRWGCCESVENQTDHLHPESVILQVHTSDSHMQTTSLPHTLAIRSVFSSFCKTTGS